ncbi:MAG: helix-turn-helix domain-containing protein [Candidatus Nitrosopolaris sp.]
MDQGCIEVPVEDKSMNMVTFSQNQEVYAGQLIIDRRCNIFADELAIWKVLGRRWTLSILKNLDTKEAIRFNELKRLMLGISSTVLAERLSELEVEGLISKKIYPEIPPKVEYSLTVQAEELRVIFEELQRWTHRFDPHRSAIEVPV